MAAAPTGFLRGARAGITLWRMLANTLPAFPYRRAGRTARPRPPGRVYGARRGERAPREALRGFQRARAGDRVALWLPNVPAWLALLFACARLGAIAQELLQGLH